MHQKQLPLAKQHSGVLWFAREAEVKWDLRVQAVMIPGDLWLDDESPEQV